MNYYGCFCGKGGKGKPQDEIDRFKKIIYNYFFNKNIFNLKAAVLNMITAMGDQRLKERSRFWIIEYFFSNIKMANLINLKKIPYFIYSLNSFVL